MLAVGLGWSWAVSLLKCPLRLPGGVSVLRLTSRHYRCVCWVVELDERKALVVLVARRTHTCSAMLCLHAWSKPAMICGLVV